MRNKTNRHDIEVLFNEQINSIISHKEFRIRYDLLIKKFKENSKYYAETMSLLKSTEVNVMPELPFVSYARLFIKLAYDIELVVRPRKGNNVPFYECYRQICNEIGNELFQNCSVGGWKTSYISSAIKELIEDISTALSPSLYDMYSEQLPFGFKISRTYIFQDDKITCDKHDDFIKYIVNSCFTDLMKKYPVSLYIVGQTIFLWHHRHLELISRLKSDEVIFGKNIEKAAEIQISLTSSGDAHNFGRKSYVIKLKNKNNKIEHLCYKPRNLSIDNLFFKEIFNLISKLVEIDIRVPQVINKGDYGYTEFISKTKNTNSVSCSQFLNGIWLYVLWILGITDCTRENFCFNGEQYILVDFETALQGYFRNLTTSTKNQLTTRALYALSCMRTYYVPVWDIEDDSFENTCLGNLPNEEFSNDSLWINANTDFIVYKSDYITQKVVANLSSRPILDHTFISELIRGFTYASDKLQNKIELLYSRINKEQNLYSRFLFRNTITYFQFSNELKSPNSLHSLTSFMSKLDRINLNEVSMNHSFFNWICEQEKMQLLGLDIPYFKFNIWNLSVETLLSKYEDFQMIYCSFKEFQSMVHLINKDSEYQKFLIDSAIQSRFNWPNYKFNFYKTRRNKILIDEIDLDNYDIIMKMWVNLISNSLMFRKNSELPMLFRLQSGNNRKDIQVKDIDNSYLIGSLGILYASSLVKKMNSKGSNQLELIHETIKSIDRSTNSDYSGPINLSPANCGLNNHGGIIYGTNQFQLDHNEKNIFIHDISISQVDVEQLAKSENLKSEIFDGICGLIIALLSTKPKHDSSILINLINILLEFQQKDGTFQTQRSESKKHLLGVAHGASGILITLLHIYNYNKSSIILNSIYKMIEGYNLDNPSSLEYFKTNSSWCTGLSGHMVSMAYLINSIPNKIDERKLINRYFNSLVKQRLPKNIYFCCGRAGILLSIRDIDEQFPNECEPFREFITNYGYQLEQEFLVQISAVSNKILMKPSILDGFSILPFLSLKKKKDIKWIRSLTRFSSSR